MSEQELAQQIAMEEMAKSVISAETAKKATAKEQLEQELEKCHKIGELCASVGLTVVYEGTWVKISDGSVTTKELSKLLGRNMQPSDPNDPDSPKVQKGLGLRWMKNKKYWAYVAKLPEGYYWDNKSKEIKERGAK